MAVAVSRLGRDMGQISWLPTAVEDGYFMPHPLFTTSGTGEHTTKESGERGTYFRGLPVEDAALDAGIAELVHALNAAGITTVGSCEDISMDDDEDSVPVMIIEFLIRDWPKLAPMIRHDAAYNESGWLVTANPNEPEIMAVLFPPSEYDDFLARVRKQASNPSCSTQETPLLCWLNDY
jgi:hypothetical protein